MINNNIKMKILSVGIAILIWGLVAYTNDPVITKRFSDIQVTVENENALTNNGYAYEITEGDRVSFSIKGKKSIINTMTEDDFDVVADFSKLSLTDAVPIDISAKRYADQIEINLGNINTMKIKKDEIISVNLPVNVSVSGEAAEGYYVGKTVATPNLIKVTGPRNLLSDAKEIRAEVDVDGISKNVTTSVSPKLYDTNGELIESSQIDVGQNNISVMIEMWRTKEVKVNIAFEGEPEQGYALIDFDYEPKTALVAASDSVYDQLNSIDLATISLDGANATYEKDVPVSSDSFPEGVVLAENLTSIKVSAKIEQIIERQLTFTTNDIQVKNNQEGYQIEYSSSDKNIIKIEGGSSVVNAATVADFTPWIDLSGLDEGEHKVNVHVKNKDGITINDVTDMHITLSK